MSKWAFFHRLLHVHHAHDIKSLMASTVRRRRGLGCSRGVSVWVGRNRRTRFFVFQGNWVIDFYVFMLWHRIKARWMEIESERKKSAIRHYLSAGWLFFTRPINSAPLQLAISCLDNSPPKIAVFRLIYCSVHRRASVFAPPARHAESYVW